jgi:hypothetical protein
MSYKIATDSPALEEGTTAIWYQKLEFFGKPKIVDTDNLSKTHVHLASIKAPDLEAAFCLMQGEVWSERGEANAMIKEMGLSHISMCVGDIVVLCQGVFQKSSNPSVILDGEKPQVVMGTGWGELTEGRYYVSPFGEVVPLQELRREVSTQEILTLLKSEQEKCFEANWNGTWDRNKVVDPHYCEDGIRIYFEKGHVLYRPPFVVEALPSDTEMLLFHCRSSEWTYYEKP